MSCWLFVAAASFAQVATTGQVWFSSTEATPIKILNVSSYWDSAGQNFIVEIELDAAAAFKCGSASQSTHFVYWDSSEYINHSLRLSPALAAKHRGQVLHLTYHQRGCSKLCVS